MKKPALRAGFNVISFHTYYCLHVRWDDIIYVSIWYKSATRLTKYSFSLIVMLRVFGSFHTSSDARRHQLQNNPGDQGDNHHRNQGCKGIPYTRLILAQWRLLLFDKLREVPVPGGKDRPPKTNFGGLFRPEHLCSWMRKIQGYPLSEMCRYVPQVRRRMP